MSREFEDCSENQLPKFSVEENESTANPEYQGSIPDENFRFISEQNVKTFSLEDAENLREFLDGIGRQKDDHNFKILKLTCANVKASLDLMLEGWFRDGFNRATHWFFTIIQIEGLSEDITIESLRIFQADLGRSKPVILQWKFSSSSKNFVFYKRSNETELNSLGELKEAKLTEEELIEELTPEGNFCLPLLLKALLHGLGGYFSGDLSRTAFDVAREFDGWRLIDYAARDDDDLSLRFLRLVEWDLAAISGEQRVLEIAAKYSGPRSISALLDQPMIGSVGKPWLSEEQKNLLELADISNNTPLTIAVEEGRTDALEYLIICGADINYRKKVRWNYFTPIQTAWENKFYDKVIALLEADSLFPDEYQLDDLSDTDIVVNLRKLTEIRKNFHRSIIDKDEGKVKDFIRDYPRLRYGYDCKNQTALLTALKAGEYEMFALLESNKFAISNGEKHDFLALMEGLSEQQKDELKQAKLRYFGKEKNTHITYLLSKWRKHGAGSEDHTRIVRELFERLDEIPEISTVLKVLEHAEALEIIFDFNKDSIVDLDPTKSSATSGSCDYKVGRLYVGAKQPLEALGTLAHELTHLAMQTVFDNDCNPYTTSEESVKSQFGEIVEEYRDRKAMDNIIARVFTVYTNPKDWPSELIVRVPHLLAVHHQQKDDPQVLEKLWEEAPELFSFYHENIQKRFEEFIRDPSRCKAQIKLWRLNDLLGQLQAIQESKIWLDSSRLLNEHQIDFSTILIISSNLPQLTQIDLYQALIRKEGDLRNKFVFTTVEHFKNDKQAREIHDSFQSPIKPILIVDCSRDYRLHYRYLWGTINGFREKARIVFVADSAIADLIQNNSGNSQTKSIRRDYIWSDLLLESQHLLLENSVDFQGYLIALNELVSRDSSSLAEDTPLQDLLHGNQIKIGKSLPVSYGYDESYYIGRIFNRYPVVRAEILSDRAGRKFLDDLAFDQADFHILCKENPRSNVHWLHKEAPNSLIWQRSRGSLERLRKYIDTSKAFLYPPEKLKDFLNLADDRKIMVISDTAGMGKTTILTHLSKSIKKLFPGYWVIKFDLSENTDKLEEQSKKKINGLEFLYEKILEPNTKFERKLFTELLDAKKVILMLDSFDEISPVYKEVVLNLLQDLRLTNIRHLWITTRPHLKENLEDVFTDFSYSLDSFSLQNQIEFLRRFWKVTLGIAKIESERKMGDYARLLIQKLMESINDKDKAFTGVPLQTRMLAEAFADDFREFDESDVTEPNLPKKLDLLEVYGRFLDRKYLIYVSEKNNPSKLNVATKDLVSILKGGTNLRKIHQQLALEVLFPAQKKTLLGPLKSHSLPPEKLNRIGIVQYTSDKPHFIHRTFAEYYAADFLVYQLAKTSIHTEEVQDFLLNQILLMPDYQVVRSFIDGLLGGSQPIEDVLRLYGNRIKEVWKEIEVEEDTPLKRYQMLMQKPLGYWKNSSEDEVKTIRSSVPPWDLKRLDEHTRDIWDNKVNDENSASGTILHQNVQESNASIIDFLLNSLRCSKHHATMKKLIFHRNNDGQTIWYGVVVIGNYTLFQKLLEFIQEIELDKRELTHHLLAPDTRKRTAWHWVAFNSNVEILQKIWSLIDDKSTLSTVRDEYGRAIWHWTTQYGTVKFLNILWGLYEEICFDFRSILTMTDTNDRNIWHYSTHNADLNMLDSVLNLAKEFGSILEAELLSTQDKTNQTAWHWSILSNNVAAVRKLWKLSKEAGLDIKSLLLKENKNSQTPWQMALGRSKPEILEMLWEFALEAGIDRKVDLLMPKSRDNLSSWHLVVRNAHGDSFDKLWEFTNELLSSEEVKKLFLHRNTYGQSVWSHAVRNNGKERLEKLWTWIRSFDLDSDELRSEFIASDIYNQTSWHWGVSNGYPGILQYLWDTYQSIEPEIQAESSVLLLKDSSERTALEWAVEYNVNSTEKFWELVQNVTLDQKRDLFIGKKSSGNTIWHTVIFGGKIEIMMELLEFSKEIGVYSKEEVLLVKNREGITPWSYTMMRGSRNVIQYVWDLGKTLGVDPKTLILDTDDKKQSSWHWIMENSHPESTDLLWVLTRDTLTQKESKAALLRGDRFGNTPWSLAAKNNSTERIVKLWKLLKSVDPAPEELADMLLFKAEEGRTSWHWIAVNGNPEMLEILEKFVEEIGCAEAFSGLVNDLDEDGYSALKHAVSEDNLEIAIALLSRGANLDSLSKKEVKRLDEYINEKCNGTDLRLCVLNDDAIN